MKSFAPPNPGITSVQNNKHTLTKQNKNDQNINTTGWRESSHLEELSNFVLATFSIITVTSPCGI